MQITIERLDHMGNGIGYSNNKIVFVPKTIPGDIVNINIESENKNYIKATVDKYIKRSDDYVESFCPYYYKCGGCSLQNLLYDKTIEYKLDRVKNILKRSNIDIDFIPIKNINDKNYRNKIELKIVNKKIGFYEKSTHNLIEIDKCQITKNCINNFFSELKNMNIINGDVLIRCNYNEELLISIKTKDDIKINEEVLPKYKVVGIIVNDKCVYGENKFLDLINNTFFEVSYDSFFQVNSYINSKLFDLIKESVQGKNILDLYSGVGTLSIMASYSASKVYAIENIPNAVINAIKNAKINKRDNINFILGNVEDKITKINDNIDYVIVDPPRKGLDNVTINKLLELKPNKILYISCETQKLSEDLKYFLNDYKIEKAYMLDMFSYSYHCEVFIVLERE